MLKTARISQNKIIASLCALAIATGGLLLPARAKQLVLSESQLEYIAQNPVLKAVSIEGGAPFHYYDSKGRLKGIAVRVLDEISAMTGIEFDIYLFPSIAAAFASSPDLVFGLTKEYAPPDSFLSSPYIKSETIVCYNSSLDPENLKGMRFAAIEGGTLPEGIDAKDAVYVPNREAALDFVEHGDADYCYSNAYSAAFYSMQNGYRNVISIPVMVEKREYCLGILDENELLLSILNQSIEAIDQSRMQTIILGVTSQVERKITYPMIMDHYWKQIFAGVLSVFVALSAAFYFSLRASRKLRREMQVSREREEKIRFLSTNDRLTGLYNRAYFEDELERTDRAGRLPISVVIGDINGLKMTNDTFGHAQGDILLQKAAEALKESFRTTDTVARYGGDEFAIIMPETPAEFVGGICKRIRKKCDQTCTEPFAASISLGWATKENLWQDINDVLKDAESMMYRHKLFEGKSIRNDIFASLEASLHEKGIEPREHIERLIELTAKLGEKLKLTPAEMGELNLLCCLHDIGKVTVDEHILKNEGKLSEREFDEIKKHAEAGYRIAESSQMLSGISGYILSHHERFDGSGYPLGIKGEEIPLLSRVFAVADAYDAMTTERIYRKALSHDEAIEEIQKYSGSQFDPAVAEVFISLFSNEP
jgi:diguanylate cyclase (GGDEF)-like protein